MEYYNTFTKEYIVALNQKKCVYKIKIELLSDEETVIGEIVKDLENIGGQLNINYERIIRRSCSLTLVNIDGKYIPNKNSNFWYKRKFKLWMGLVVKDDIYWWAQGVFYTKSADVQSGSVNIEGVDKGAALDGTLKLNMANVQYYIKRGSSLSNLIKDTLSRSMGTNDTVVRGQMVMTNSTVIDSALPYIHTRYGSAIVQSDISVDAGAYIGDVFIELSDLYNAEVYYDVNGHFRFEPCVENSGYNYAPKQWEFIELSSVFENANYSYRFDEGENAVCVYTNTSQIDTPNVSYTAYNTNPSSPINISVGLRRASQEIEYYDVSEIQMVRDCRSAANRYLRQHSMLNMQLDFNSHIIPHMDVNGTIGITDRYIGVDSETFVVNSITIPLNSNQMSISCTNINWLPNDIEYDGIVGR